MKRIEHQKTASPTTVLLFSGAIVLQIVGMSLFPLTAGYTKFWPTLASILALLLGSSLFCRMLYKGVALSFLIPLGSAVIPLVVSMLGIFVYEESISALKITLLIVACALIGIDVMDSLPATTIGLFLIATMFSLGATAIWPRTQGFTRPIPTALSILMQVICLVLMNRIVDSGVELSFLVPLNGAFSPLVMIFVGVFLYKEKASVWKIAVLLTACVLIGFANFL